MVESKDQTLAKQQPLTSAEGRNTPEAGDQRLGDIVAGRYRLTRLLGRGAMGTVYEAQQDDMERLVALKILNREYAQNPMIVRRFHQEALAASRLTHPNTITVFDHGQSGDDLFITMECLVGRTLKAELAQVGRLTPETAIHILVQLLKSVGEAHRKGIVHRDVKPENIFLTTVDEDPFFVKVLDFGVAKLKTASQDETLTQAGHLFGTPKYMAPEQARDGEVDARADLYSIGIIAYEMIVGRPPYVGDNPLGLLLAHANQSPPRMAELCDDSMVDAGLERVVFTALAKDRQHRHPSAEAFIDDLTTASAPAQSDHTFAPSALDIAIRQAGSSSAEIQDIRPTPPPQRRRASSVILPLVGFLIVSSLILGLIVLTNSDRASTPSKVAKNLAEQTSVTQPMETKTMPVPSRLDQVQDESDARLTPPAAETSVSDNGKSAIFTIGSLPAGADIIDADTNKRMGATPTNLSIQKPMSLTLIRAGFKPVTIKVSPTQTGRSVIRTLKPLRAPNRAPSKRVNRMKMTESPTSSNGNPPPKEIVIRRRVEPQPSPKSSSSKTVSDPLELE